MIPAESRQSQSNDMSRSHTDGKRPDSLLSPTTPGVPAEAQSAREEHSDSGAVAVTVIVPVYNVEKYLQGCIDSIKSQSFGDFELILIDDGSTDDSGAICDRAAKDDPRVKVVHQEHGGPSIARNVALDMARGNYYIFIDSDDLVPHDYIQTLLDGARKYEADIFSVKLMRFKNDSEVANVMGGGDLGNVAMYNGEEVARRVLYQKGNPDNSASGKIFKADLWRDTRFREGTLYEDLDLVYRVMLKADRVAVSDRELYFYRRNDSSILGRFYLKRADVLIVTNGICEYVEHNYPQLVGAAISRRLSAAFNMLLLFKKHCKSATANTERINAVIGECIAIIRRDRRRCLFDGNVRLKNKLGILLSYPLLLFSHND